MVLWTQKEQAWNDMLLATKKVICGHAFGQRLTVRAWLIWLAWLLLANDVTLRVEQN